MINKFETFEEALRYDITISGKNLKEVANAVWPSTDITRAHNRLMDILNIAKNHKATVEEIACICNFCDSYEALYFIVALCNHEKPQKIKFEKIQEKTIADVIIDNLSNINDTTALMKKHMEMAKRDHPELFDALRKADEEFAAKRAQSGKGNVFSINKK